MAYWTAVWRASEEDAATAWRTLRADGGKAARAVGRAAMQPTNLERRDDRTGAGI